MWLRKKWRDKIESLSRSLDETRSNVCSCMKENNYTECETCGCLVRKCDVNKLPSTVEQEDIYGHSPLLYYPQGLMQSQQAYQPVVVGKREVIKSHYRCKRCGPPEEEKNV